VMLLSGGPNKLRVRFGVLDAELGVM
jgi:hypothetical protein